MESEGDLDHNYPNLTIHCDCGSSLDWGAVPTYNCDVQKFDTFIDIVEEPNCILYALWYLDLHSLVSQYLYIRA
jgi:hypothetical protein